MAVYKVIQDIEAEDKLLGPLTFKQFIYALIVAALGFFGYILFGVNPVLVIIVIPPMVVFGFLAAPLGREQPNEIWLAARVGFYLKPRKRIWDQSGLEELVTITAPKVIEKVYSNNLSQTEVRSRLHALADTLDSRGWAVKNADINMYSHPAYAGNPQGSDRLVGAAAPSQAAPALDVKAADDILDPAHNPVAQNFDRMMQQAAQEHRQQVVSQMQQVASGQPAGSGSPTDYWFMYENNQSAASPAGYATFGQQVVSPQAPAPAQNDDTPLLKKNQDEDEAAAAKTIKSQPSSKSHLKTILPLSEQAKLKKAKKQEKTDAEKTATTPNQSVTAPPPPAILELANNDDLSVATLAQQAKRVQGQDSNDNEVVISLH